MFYEHLKKIEIQIVCVDGWGGCINKWVDGKAVAEMAGGIRYLKIKITEEDIKSFSDWQENANMKRKLHMKFSRQIERSVMCCRIQ